MTPLDDLSVLFDTMKIADYKRMANRTGHTRFPVVNESYKLVGIVTSREMINTKDDDEIDKSDDAKSYLCKCYEYSSKLCAYDDLGRY